MLKSQAVVIYIFSFILFSLGVVGLGWGLARLVEYSEAPLCYQEFSQSEAIAASGLGSLRVDVAGAVVKPGVYELPFGSFISQALELAGGLSDQADRLAVQASLNLATRLEDGDKIYIPVYQPPSPTPARGLGGSGVVIENHVEEVEPGNMGEVEEDLGQEQSLAGVVQNSSAANGVGSGQLVSLNRATSLELEELYGIGPKRAADIIQNRPFSRINQLLELKVVPQSVFDRIKSQLSL